MSAMIDIPGLVWVSRWDMFFDNKNNSAGEIHRQLCECPMNVAD